MLVFSTVAQSRNFGREIFEAFFDAEFKDFSSKGAPAERFGRNDDSPKKPVILTPLFFQKLISEDDDRSQSALNPLAERIATSDWMKTADKLKNTEL